MNAHIHSLQDQVNHLYACLDALRNGQAFPTPEQAPDQYAIHPALAQSDPYRPHVPSPQSHDTQPRFSGPTSSAFSFDVARSSLQTMGITAPDIQDPDFNEDNPPTNTSPRQLRAPMAPMAMHNNKDPLWKISRDEAIRLCRVYEEEMGLMYPLIDMMKLLTLANSLFKFTEAAAKSGLMNPHKAGPDSLGNNDIWILKMVIACGLIVEGEGQSELGGELYESCREAFEARVSGPVEIKGLILLTLVVGDDQVVCLERMLKACFQAEYNFQRDEEVQAYRILGLATRQCVEIGLHRRTKLLEMFTQDEERSWAIKLFWSIYVLDRRWSFGTGMPFALQDADIDPQLPESVCAASLSLLYSTDLIG